MANVRHILSDDEHINELTDNGTKQAQLTGEQLRIFAITNFFTSPVLRAKQTAQIISEYIKIKPIVDKRLWERHFMNMNGKPSLDGYWKFSDDKSYESWDDVRKRALDFIDSIKKNKCTLAVTHHDVISAIIGSIYDLDEMQSYGVSPQYASISVFEQSSRGAIKLLCSSLPKIPDRLIDKIPEEYLKK